MQDVMDDEGNIIADIPSLASLLGDYEISDNQSSVPQQSSPSQIKPEKFTSFGFSIGDFKFILPENCRSEILVDIRPSTFPNSPAMFAGVINLRGDFVPVYQLEEILNINYELSKNRFILILGTADEMVGIFLTEIPRNYQISISAETPVLPDLPPTLSGAVSTAYLIDSQCRLTFDHKVFFDNFLEKLQG